MITTTAWAHLPNAIHIDRVLASVNSHPVIWERLSWGVQSIGYYSVCDDVWDDAYGTTCKFVYDSVSASAYDLVFGAILALIAYDDSAHLLDSTPEEIRLLVALGHPYAILFLLAVTVSANINA